MPHKHTIQNKLTSNDFNTKEGLHNHRVFRVKVGTDFEKGITTSDKNTKNHIHEFKGVKTSKPVSARVT